MSANLDDPRVWPNPGVWHLSRKGGYHYIHERGGFTELWCVRKTDKGLIKPGVLCWEVTHQDRLMAMLPVSEYAYPPFNKIEDWMGKYPLLKKNGYEAEMPDGRVVSLI